MSTLEIKADKETMSGLLISVLKSAGSKAKTKIGAKRMIKKLLKEMKEAGHLTLDKKAEDALVNEVVKQVWFTGG